MRVLGVIDTINLKNLGMYGVGNGMFESRYKHQGTRNMTTEQGYLALLSAACVTLNCCSGKHGYAAVVYLLKLWELPSVKSS